MRHEDAENEGFGQLQIPGEDVGLIGELLDDAQDSLLGRGGDTPALVKDPVDRADGYARQPGDRFDRADVISPCRRCCGDIQFVII